MTGFMIGVASGVLATLLTRLAAHWYQRARGWYRFRPFHQVWHPFSVSPTSIVLTGKKQGHTVKISVSETDAAGVIRNLLAQNRDVSQLVSERDSIQLEHHNIIALGSERTNEVTGTLLQSLSGALSYSYTADNNLIVNGELFRSRYKDNVLIRDYALVCKATNPFSRGRKFLIFAGNHGIGTHGAVLAITSGQPAADVIQRVGGSDFFAVVETETDQRFGRSPTRVAVRRCGLLPIVNGHNVENVVESREARLLAFLAQQGADDNYLRHVKERANLGVRIGNALESNGIDVDMDAVYFGAMLHDIGRLSSPTIAHGVRGVELVEQHRKSLTADFALMPDSFAKICEAIECHVVGGIPQRWIEEATLPLPIKDYIPKSLESKIVAFCDQVLHDRNSEDVILTEAPQYDHDIRKQFYKLTCDIIKSLFQQGQTDEFLPFMSEAEDGEKATNKPDARDGK